MATEIRSNGSHWAGEAPDTIEQLLECLSNHALDRVFEQCGNFYEVEGGGSVRFFGNFRDVSHVFNITSDDPEVTRKLIKAIDLNRQRPDYKSQPKPKAGKVP